jgi:DNA gyrase subunit A
MTTGHGEPIGKHFAFEDREHVIGVICHDPRCLPDVPATPAISVEPVQAMLGGELSNLNGDGPNSGLPLPPYGIALTAAGKVLRFALSAHSGVSTRKGRAVVRLDPTYTEDRVVGVEATDGTENVCLATRSARVLIFPVAEVNVVAGAAKGVTAVKLDSKDAVIGFALANKMREGLTVRTNRGAIQIVRATKYPVTGRGGKGYGILQRGSLEAVIHDDAVPVPPVEQVGE